MVENQNDGGNPFSGLFAQQQQQQKPTDETCKTTSSSTNILDTKTNALIEKIFLFTINKSAGFSKSS